MYIRHVHPQPVSPAKRREQLAELYRACQQALRAFKGKRPPAR